MDVNRSFAFDAARRWAASDPFQRVLTGTRAAPAQWAPRAATIHPSPLAAHTATRSPRPTPAAIIARVAVHDPVGQRRVGDPLVALDDRLGVASGGDGAHECGRDRVRHR